MKKKIKFYLIFSLLFLTSCHYFRTLFTSDIPQGVGGISGYVYSEQNSPVAEVVVTVNQLSTQTDDRGKFLLAEVPTGRQKITFQKKGYITTSHWLEIPRRFIEKKFILKKGTLIEGEKAIISQDPVYWEREDNPFFIEDDLLIKEGGRLIVDNGVQAYFAEGKRVLIEGKLEIKKGSQETVFTTQNETIFWGGIFFGENLTSLNERISELIISRAEVGITFEQNPHPHTCVKIIRTKLLNNRKYGIYAEDCNSLLILENVIRGNKIAGICLKKCRDQVVVNRNLIEKNGAGIYVDANCKKVKIGWNEIKDNNLETGQKIGVALEAGYRGSLPHSIIYNNIRDHSTFAISLIPEPVSSLPLLITASFCYIARGDEKARNGYSPLNITFCSRGVRLTETASSPIPLSVPLPLP
jgi:parallel beta-helix repeat protein